MVVEKLRTTVDAQMPFDVTLEILVAMAIGLIGVLLLLKTTAKKAVGSQAIVAVCELTVAGSAGSSVAISPSPGVTDRPKSHLERTPSAKQFVPERASRVSGTVKLVEVDGACMIEVCLPNRREILRHVAQRSREKAAQLSPHSRLPHSRVRSTT